jgi:hypothetical protein
MAPLLALDLLPRRSPAKGANVQPSHIKRVVEDEESQNKSK